VAFRITVLRSLAGIFRAHEDISVIFGPPIQRFKALSAHKVIKIRSLVGQLLVL
jgi:hypothetical protein